MFFDQTQQLTTLTSSQKKQFTASYHDLRVTFRRYGHCVGSLPPLKDHSLNETEFLVQQMRVFLDQANYDNEQLQNVSALMDNICQRGEPGAEYPISAHINVTLYNDPKIGKHHRCKAIDEAMDSMFTVFKRAAFNKSEPLDFSTILFYPESNDKNIYYNLTDLINTSWIKSDTMLESTCKITDAVKEYVLAHTSNSTAQDRSHQQQSGFINSLIEFLDRLLNPILGLQKRLYWEGNNRFEMVYSTIGNQLTNWRNSLGKTFKSTREHITGVFGSSQATNVTSNATTSLNSSLNFNNNNQ